MRHTRTKHLIRLTGGKYWEYMPNVRIDEMRKLLSDYELDKSFEWHREYGREIMPWGQNYISFGNVVRLVKF